MNQILKTWITTIIAVIMVVSTVAGGAVSTPSEKDVKIIERVEGKQRAARDKYAIVVGVNDYVDDNLYRDLEFANNDAKTIAKILSSEQAGLYNVSLLTTDQTNLALKPTRGSILNEIDRILRFTEPGDTVIFFFSGHGIQDNNGTDFILPMDAGNNPGMTGISLKDLETLFSEDDATVKLAFIDACRTNPYSNKASSRTGLGYAFEIAEGTKFILSAKRGQPSYETPGRQMGLFTYGLSKALTEPGAADANGDGVVSLRETETYLLSELKQLALKERVQPQIPYSRGEFTGDVVLSFPGKQAAVKFSEPQPVPAQPQRPVSSTPQASTPAPSTASPSSCPPEMAYIPAGEFVMGCSPTGDNECEEDEKPTKYIYVNAFCMDIYEFPNMIREYPLDDVDWDDAKKHCESAGKRLPTEAEWEKAARGLTATKYYWGKQMDDSYIWHYHNASPMKHLSGLKKPNVYGLYDMLGNLQEWVEDCYDENWYYKMPPRDPVNKSCMNHVVRGGSYGDGIFSGKSSNIRVSSRDSAPHFGHNNLFGFRCAKDIE